MPYAPEAAWQFDRIIIAFDKNVAVIGIASEAVAAPVQFPI